MQMFHSVATDLRSGDGWWWVGRRFGGRAEARTVAAVVAADAAAAPRG